jgi:hypothetical protein
MESSKKAKLKELELFKIYGLDKITADYNPNHTGYDQVKASQIERLLMEVVDVINAIDTVCVKKFTSCLKSNLLVSKRLSCFQNKYRCFKKIIFCFKKILTKTHNRSLNSELTKAFIFFLSQ